MPGLGLRAPDPELRDHRVTLRVLADRDVPGFLAGLRDPAIARFAYAGRLAADQASVQEYIDRVPARLASGDALLLAVLDAETGTFCGKTMLFGVDWDQRSAEIGFWLSPAARGRGLAARAVALTVRWAFDDLALERVQGLTDIENEPAQQVMVRVGFYREGILRGLERRSQGRADMISYSLLSTDEIRA